MKITPLGEVAIAYREDGSLKEAGFTPARKDIKFDKSKLMELRQIDDDKNEEHIKASAEAIFSSWFNGIIDIELADITKSRLESKIIYCKKFDNGYVERCVISFSFIED